VGDSITKVTNYYIAATITNTIHFLVNMFTLSNVTNAPIFASYHCPLVAMVKEHTRRVPLYRHCLSFSPPHTHTDRTMKFYSTVNQLARVLCTHYLEDSNTGADNITIKWSWVDNTNTQYTTHLHRTNEVRKQIPEASVPHYFQYRIPKLHVKQPMIKTRIFSVSIMLSV
jgi:hypothetical protein